MTDGWSLTEDLSENCPLVLSSTEQQPMLGARVLTMHIMGPWTHCAVTSPLWWTAQGYANTEVGVQTSFFLSCEKILSSVTDVPFYSQLSFLNVNRKEVCCSASTSSWYCYLDWKTVRHSLCTSCCLVHKHSGKSTSSTTITISHLKRKNRRVCVQF